MSASAALPAAALVRSRPRTAGVVRRTAAFALDAALLTLLVFAAAAVVSLTAGPAAVIGAQGDVQPSPAVGLAVALVGIVISAAYFVVSWTERGATPGQALLRVRVVAGDDGAPLTRRAATVRWLALAGPFGAVGLVAVLAPGLGVLAADVLLVLWYLVLLASTAFGADRRGIHDRLAHSIVRRAGAEERRVR